MLEPEVKVQIVEGMEIKVGGSTLKFMLGWLHCIFYVRFLMAGILEIQSINQSKHFIISVWDK
jgi:hypothetical protein